ncbi:acyl-CoA thioesterase [Halobacteriovorax vibrionivorans]|uniref:Acyl-CoA thioesterase n=1 Tax=Halobacteriovorax vibrionivorans TaxID=2152716 RepID=A0ABY0IHV6_9BACT|nr:MULTISPECIES: acyl-CoA thioesterase [Halobacteriovorax]RZF20917.1 acyl-CoA thioesterase [Halobacteriovorax vibrionivorans]TGD46017.1 acyl-CoA thioesterase [Halobacteriovorax sp. Y22]
MVGKNSETQNEQENIQPEGELSVRTLTMPCDTNHNGDIFGGWVLSQMDIAGAIYSGKRCNGRTATIAIEAMKFIQPVGVGDILCCYCSTVKEGNTSLSVKVEAWVVRKFETERVKVTSGVFTYVAIDEDKRPRSINSKTVLK